MKNNLIQNLEKQHINQNKLIKWNCQIIQVIIKVYTLMKKLKEKP